MRQWDGTRLEFTTGPLPGTSSPARSSGPRSIYRPVVGAGRADPSAAELGVIGGPTFPIEFVRPADLDWLNR